MPKTFEKQLSLITDKIKNLDSNLLQKIRYYNKEIEHSKNVMDHKVKEAEEKYLNYREYCENTLKRIKDHSAIERESLEKKKRDIELKKIRDEESD